MISLAVLAAGWVVVLSPGDYAILKFPPLSRHSHLTFGGGVQGSTRLAATSKTIRTASGLSSVPDGTGTSLFGTGTQPNYFVLDPSFDDGSTYQTALQLEQSHEDLSSGAGYGFDHIATRGTPPSGVGTTRTSRTINGFTGGLLERLTFPSAFAAPDPFTNKDDQAEDFTLTISAENNRLSVSLVADTKINGTTLNFNFGDLTGVSRSAFIDDNTFAALGNGSQFVDSLPADFRALLVNQEVAPATNFLPTGVTFCSCQYLEWGYWIAEVTPSANTFRDRIHLATWVAGEVSQLANLSSLTGTASYSGHAVGSVSTGGAIYQAAGTYTSTVNFDNPAASTTNITNFDGANYTGSGITIGSGTSGLNNFIGSLTGVGRTVALTGSFIAGGGDAAAEVGGNFIIDGGSTYRAAGIIAAKKN